MNDSMCCLSPLKFPQKNAAGKKTPLAQLCIIKVKSIPPVLAYKLSDVCEMRMVAMALFKIIVKVNVSDQLL